MFISRTIRSRRCRRRQQAMQYSTAKKLSFRDPVTVPFSTGGPSWGGTAVAITCTALSPTSTCKLRYPGASKNGGPSYPQALTVTAPAPATVQGLYVASSNNKEDIWRQ